MKQYLAKDKYLEFVKEYGRIPTREEFVDQLQYCKRSRYFQLKKLLEEEVEEILKGGDLND